MDIITFTDHFAMTLNHSLFHFLQILGFIQITLSFLKNLSLFPLCVMDEQSEDAEIDEGVKMCGFVRMLVTGCLSLEYFEISLSFN